MIANTDVVVVALTALSKNPPSDAVAFVSYVVNVNLVLVVLPATITEPLWVAFADMKRRAVFAPVRTVLPDIVSKSELEGVAFLIPTLLLNASRNNRSVSNAALPLTATLPLTLNVVDILAKPVIVVLPDATVLFIVSAPLTVAEPTTLSVDEILAVTVSTVFAVSAQRRVDDPSESLFDAGRRLIAVAVLSVVAPETARVFEKSPEDPRSDQRKVVLPRLKSWFAVGLISPATVRATARLPPTDRSPSTRNVPLTFAVPTTSKPFSILNLVLLVAIYYLT